MCKRQEYYGWQKKKCACTPKKTFSGVVDGRRSRAMCLQLYIALEVESTRGIEREGPFSFVGQNKTTCDRWSLSTSTTWVTTKESAR
ncbi:F-box domain-containing protein [Psidium guajava]|nr:F-box domain-containing protein [Psidium guajava]